MAKIQTVAEYLSQAIEISGKTQLEIAREVGYSRPNVLSMMKQGQTKVPIDKVPGLAEACGVDPASFLRLVLREYMPETYKVISKHLGPVLDDEEMVLLNAYRLWREEKQIDAIAPTQKEFLEVFANIR